MDREELKAIVAQMLRELAPAQTPPSPPPVKGAETETPPDDGVLPDLTTVDLRAQYLVPNAAHGAEFRALKAKTPARLGLGRCGARYPTASLLRFRADHAAAQDSVFSLVPERFWEENHYPFVQTMCKSKDEYLTRPDLGRRFDEKNQAVLRDLLAGQRVVLAVGDGLSSAAVQANAPDCCAAIRQGLQAQGPGGGGGRGEALPLGGLRPQKVAPACSYGRDASCDHRGHLAAESCGRTKRCRPSAQGEATAHG